MSCGYTACTATPLAFFDIEAHRTLSHVRSKVEVLRDQKVLSYKKTGDILAAIDCFCKWVDQICAITGHKLRSAHSILEHYLPRDSVMAAEGVKKLEEYEE